MNNIRVIFSATLFILASSAAYGDYTVECSGTNDETSEAVSGECSNGDFDGADDNTGNSVSGECRFGGELDAVDQETDQHVSGECEGE